MEVKNKILFLLVILLMSGLIHFFNLNHIHNWGDDFAIYINQAKSIIDGSIEKTVSDITFVAKNSIVSNLPSFGTVPWGFPILLSLIYYFFGMNFFAMKIFILFFFLLSLVTIYLLFKDRLDSFSTLLLVSIFAFNPYLSEFNNIIISDIPYIFFSLFSVYLIERFIFKENFLINRTFSFILLGIFIFYSFYMRTIGIFLLLSLFVCQLIKFKTYIKQEFKSFFIKNKSFFLPYLIFLTLFFLGNKFFPNSAGGSQLKYSLSSISKGDLKQILLNLKDYIELPAEFFNPHFSRMIYGFTLPFFMFGICKNFRRDYLFLLYPLFVSLFLIIYPSGTGQGLRYIFSLCPFYIYFTCTGLIKIYSELRNFNCKFNPNYTFGILLIIVFMLQSLFSTYLQIMNKKIIDGPFSAESKEVFNFISRNTTEEDVIIFIKPMAMLLFAKRKAIKIIDPSQSDRGDYIVIHKQLDKSIFTEQVLKKKDKFKLIAENKNFLVCKIKSEIKDVR